jgi:hypothetical protein
MMSVRLNITMDEEVYLRLKKQVPPKKLSTFINDAVRMKLHPDKQTLDRAYRAASKEAWRQDFSKDWDEIETEGWPS